MLADVAYALAHPTPKDGSLRRIEPETLVLISDGELRHHIVLTPLAFHHGHTQAIQVPPARLQRAAILPIAGALVGILAPTVCTLLINRPRLATDPTRTADGATKLGRDFLLQKRLQDEGHPVDDALLDLAFNGLENRFSLLCL